MTEKETYSVSRLRTYDDCARKYWWQYRQGVRKPFFAQAAVELGSAVHGCLEAGLRRWHATDDAAQGVAVAVEQAASHDDPRVLILVSAYAPEILLNRGLLGVASLPDGSAAVEVKLNVTLGGHQFTGFVDAVLINGDGEPIAVDWKCRSKFYDSASVALDSQLYFYMVALQRQFGMRMAYALQVELSTGKVPAVATHRLNPAHADRMTAELVAVADRLSQDTVFAGRNNAYVCKSCDYLMECESTLDG